MKITGAVLETSDATRPYSRSAPISVCELELDGPRSTEVLVQIEAAGICHSDLSVVDGNRRRPVPMLLGHEAAGRVLQIGTAVTSLQVGDRVVMTFLPRCGECSGCATNGLRPCITGTRTNNAGELLAGGRRLRRGATQVHHHLGVSAFASHTVVDARSVVRVDDDVPADVAAVLGCAVLTGGGAVLNAARVQAGQTVAVVGLGGVGMASVLTALAVDAKEVVAVDPLAAKRAAALDIGATRALAPDDVDDLRVDVVIEAAGNVRALETAIGITQAGGTTVTVGLPAPDARASFSPTALVAEARTIIGSYLGSALPTRDIPAFAQMWREGRLPVERLISGTVPLSEINIAMEELAMGAVLRQIIRFDDD
jgi:alcohol dehydrogenase